MAFEINEERSSTAEIKQQNKSYMKTKKPSQTSKMLLFAKIINCIQPLAVFAKSSILDVLLGSEYASEYNLCY